jgi:predicted translin family RNA/ssDNA-binding protein
LATLKSILKEVKEELMQKDKVRENAHQNMRKATSLSKQAILLMHQKKFEKATDSIENAKEIISKLEGLKNILTLSTAACLARRFKSTPRLTYF